MLPRHVQKDPEASLTWTLKDEIVGRGRVYYGKLSRGRATFIAPRLVPYFKAGLDNNERCLWVTGEAFNAQQARSALRTAVPDLDRRERDKQIEIANAGEWYAAGDKLRPHDLVTGLLQREEDALAFDDATICQNERPHIRAIGVEAYERLLDDQDSQCVELRTLTRLDAGGLAVRADDDLASPRRQRERHARGAPS